MKTSYIDQFLWKSLLLALTPENRLAVEISMATGLRISDVLALPAATKQRAFVRDAKTGKSHRVYFPAALYRRMQLQKGSTWIFPHRLKPDRHRTRQAVWKDIKRAAKAFRIPEELCVAPHSARKAYAVALYRKTGSLQAVQRKLCHSDPAVTVLYAFADVLTQRELQARAARP